MKFAALVAGTAMAVSALVMGGNAQAAGNWWPAKVYSYDSAEGESGRILSRWPKASKPWNICVLFPHMKDTFWVAVDYGVVEEAQADGRQYDAVPGRRL